MTSRIEHLPDCRFCGESAHAVHDAHTGEWALWHDWEGKDCPKLSNVWFGNLSCLRTTWERRNADGAVP